MTFVSDFNQRIDDAMQHGLIHRLAFAIAINTVQDELDELVTQRQDQVLAPTVERHFANVHDVLARVIRRAERHVRVVAHVLLHILSIQVAFLI